MLAIGRALMGEPKFLMLDEPSLGIAPRLISTIFEKIIEINREKGIAILLVEQNANLALEVSSYAYVLETGHVTMEGPSAELKKNPQLKAAYLGHPQEWSKCPRKAASPQASVRAFCALWAAFFWRLWACSRRRRRMSPPCPWGEIPPPSRSTR
jgi:ABC-type multidrug transport system ATPase subunit